MMFLNRLYSEMSCRASSAYFFDNWGRKFKHSLSYGSIF